MQLSILMLMFCSLAWFISWGMVAILFYPTKSILGWQAPLIGWTKKIDVNAYLGDEKLHLQLEQVLPMIDQQLDDFFRNRLTDKLPMIAMFIGDKTIQQLKTVFMEELKQIFPDLIRSFALNIQKEMLDQLEKHALRKIKKQAMKTTAPLRKWAILIGLIWGIFAYFVLNFF